MSELDLDIATSEAELQVARLTWGTEGNDALETILTCLPGILEAAFRAGTHQTLTPEESGLIGYMEGVGE